MGCCWSKRTKFQFYKMNRSRELMYTTVTMVMTAKRIDLIKSSQHTHKWLLCRGDRCVNELDRGDHFTMYMSIKTLSCIP